MLPFSFFHTFVISTTTLVYFTGLKTVKIRTRIQTNITARILTKNGPEFRYTFRARIWLHFSGLNSVLFCSFWYALFTQLMHSFYKLLIQSKITQKWRQPAGGVWSRWNWPRHPGEPRNCGLCSLFLKGRLAPTGVSRPPKWYGQAISTPGNSKNTLSTH